MTQEAMILKAVRENTKETSKLKRLFHQLVSGDVIKGDSIIDYTNLTRKELADLHRQSEIRREMSIELLDESEKENRQLRIDLADVQNERNKLSEQLFQIKADAVGQERVYNHIDETTDAAIKQLLTMFNYEEATQILDEVERGETNIYHISKLAADRYQEAMVALEKTREPVETKRPTLRSIIFGKRRNGGRK